MDEDKFFHALCNFRAKTNSPDKHIYVQFDLSFTYALPISTWLEIFESEKLSSLVNPEQWHLSYFQVLEREEKPEPAES